MRDYAEGWAVRAPWDGSLWSDFSRTRAEAIMKFLTIVTREVHDEAVERAKTGAVFPQTEMTETARQVWPKWRRKGYMAVHVQMMTCDHRVKDGVAS